MTDRYDTGMQTRRQVLGDAHVDRSLSNATALDAEFQRWITETAWGDVWSRPDLDRRTRSLVTIAILGALGKEEELGLHMRASRNTGVTDDELREVLFHVAVYAGVPSAIAAFRVAKRVLAD